MYRVCICTLYGVSLYDDTAVSCLVPPIKVRTQVCYVQSTQSCLYRIAEYRVQSTDPLPLQAKTCPVVETWMIWKGFTSNGQAGMVLLSSLHL